MITTDTRVDHLAIAARFAADPHDWPVAARFNPARRWYHRLAVEPDHEVWLLTWLPGQDTDRLDVADRYDVPVILICQQGYASSLAAASLLDLGLLRATDVTGGFDAWRAAGLPVTPPDPGEATATAAASPAT